MPLITFLGIVYQQVLFTSIIVLNVLFRTIVDSTQVIKKVVLITLFSQNNSMKLWLIKKKGEKDGRTLQNTPKDL